MTSSPLPSSNSADLDEIDTLFHEEYARRARGLLRERLEDGVPVILRIEDELVLHYRGERHARRIDSDVFHLLKVVTHVPLTVFLAAGSREDVATRIARNPALLERIAKLTDESLRRDCEEILSAGVQLEHGSGDEPLPGLRARIRRLLRAAAHREVADIHDSVEDLKLLVSHEDFRRCHVVVAAAHQPRHRELSKTYFKTLFDEADGEGASREERVLYAESCTDEQAALGLLAAHWLDARLARTFLGDARALREDVLADAGEPVVEQVLG